MTRAARCACGATLDGETGELLLAAVERHALVAHPEVFATAERRLTEREEQIAELVATGRTNHEVALALGLGAKTVETHLTRIYRKLGLRSRTELAALRRNSP